MTFVAGIRVLDSGEQPVVNYVWDANLLQWIPQTAGSGGGPSSDVNVTNPSIPVTQSGVWSVGRTWTLSSAGDSVNVGNFPATQAISAASLPLPSGAATEATLAALNAKIPALGQAVMSASLPVVLASNQSAVPVSGPLTDAQLRASAVPVSAASLPLPAGAATETTLAAINAKFGSLGQKAMAGSAPVVLASDQTAIPTAHGKTIKSASFSLSATGTVVAAVGGRRIKVFAVKLVVSAAISVNFRDGATTNLEGAQALAANGGFVEGVTPPGFLFGTSVGNSLDLVISGTGTAAGRVSYWDDDAS